MDLNFDIDRALLWIVLLPLFGAAIIGTAGRTASRRLVAGVGIGSVATAFVLAVLCFLELVSRKDGAETASLSYDVFEWFSITLGSGPAGAAGIESVPIRVRFVMDSLSGVMTLVVTGIGLLIHIYSSSYMAEDSSYARFFAYLNLFTASMLILVLASNLPLMFVGWEGVGLCSYLLIGFWFQNADYAKAGRKAFVVNRIGDFGVLIGMFILVAAARSFEFGEINQHAESLGSTAFEIGRVELGVSLATVACLLLFLGATGKSAQIPLYVWLPDAMAGPTPVSALIHAATMVTAGVYLLCRLSPVLLQSPAAMAVVAVVGTLTALLAASIALVQNQIKKILAYSTVSQLGFMFAAVGVGAFAAGFFHVFTHAFFKACLFLGAGSVMHAVGAHGDADVRELGGLRKWMPWTHVTFLISCLAIAGVPPFSGFFSKDEILLGAASVGEFFTFAPWLGKAVWAGLVIAATLTAFYMFRLYILTFTGVYRGAQSHSAEHDAHTHASHGHDPHESPPAITVPLLVLAAGATVVGFLGLPHWLHLPNVLGDWLAPSLAEFSHGDESHLHTTGLNAMFSGILAAFVGVLGASLVYRKGQGRPAQAMADRLGPFYRLLLDKWRVDEFYTATVVRLNHAVARLASVLDRYLVDGVITWVTSRVIQVFGFLAARLQSGLIHTYAAAMVLGSGLVVWWFAFPHASVRTRVDGMKVEYVAAEGAGYEYRWDVDADGAFDADWAAQSTTAQHAYKPKQVRGGVLILERFGQKEAPQEIRVPRDDWTLLDLSSGTIRNFRSWVSMSKSVPPAARFVNGAIVLRPNGYAVWSNGREIPRTQKELRLSLGETVHILEPNGAEGSRNIVGTLRAAGWVRGILEVRNAFGNIARQHVDVTVRPKPEVPVEANTLPTSPDRIADAHLGSGHSGDTR